jgi:predicted 3-demethylubiquinone-9 3-methyltransferase (glyoxalase superfamily)
LGEPEIEVESNYDDLLPRRPEDSRPQLSKIESQLRLDNVGQFGPASRLNRSCTMPSITPFLWFDTDLAEPIAFYTSIFPDAEGSEAPGDGNEGPVFSASIELCGQQLLLLNGGPVHAGFTESISLLVSVETQVEIDDLWERLIADGGQASRCGWLKDRYGLSWQIVPTLLGTLLGSSNRTRAQQATDAMMTMERLDIAALQAAYDG